MSKSPLGRRWPARATASVVVALAIVIVNCGGSAFTLPDALGDGGSSSLSAAMSSASASSVGGSSDAAPSAADASPDAGSSADVTAVPPSVDASSSDGSLSGDAQPTDAAPSNDAEAAISCGGTACAQACCAHSVTGQPPYTMTCEAALVCASAGGQAYRCRSAADCPSGICCMAQSQSGTIATCRTTACQGGEQQLCEPSAADTGCPTGRTCRTQASGGRTLPDGIGTCG